MNPYPDPQSIRIFTRELAAMEQRQMKTACQTLGIALRDIIAPIDSAAEAFRKLAAALARTENRTPPTRKQRLRARELARRRDAIEALTNL